MKALKKIAGFAYCLLFFAACTVPGAILFMPSDEDGTAEKRQLAEKPVFFSEDGTFNENFSAECLA